MANEQGGAGRRIAAAVLAGAVAIGSAVKVAGDDLGRWLGRSGDDVPISVPHDPPPTFDVPTMPDPPPTLDPPTIPVPPSVPVPGPPAGADDALAAGASEATEDPVVWSVLRDAGWGTLCGVVTGEVELTPEGVAADLAQGLVEAGLSQVDADLTEMAFTVLDLYEAEPPDVWQDACEDAGEILGG